MYTDEEKGEKLNRLYRAMFLCAEPPIDLREDHDEIAPWDHEILGELYQHIIEGWVQAHREGFDEPEHELERQVQFMLMNNGPSVS